MRQKPVPILNAAIAVIALGSLVAGGWAIAAPAAFFRTIAPFPPYNQHLIHDIGAFQIGLGACLVAGLVASDALLAVLAGNAAGAVAHFASHLMDRAEGGHPSDPVTIGALALLLVLLALARVATTQYVRAATRSALATSRPPAS